MNEKELMILRELRRNARRSLTEIGHITNIPLSSVFKKVIKLEKKFIKKYVSLINFTPLGFGVRINLVLKSKDKASLNNFLLAHPNVNSLYKISQNFDFLAETIFPNMLEFENFLEKLNDFVSEKKIFHIIENLRMEDFEFIEDDSIK